MLRGKILSTNGYRIMAARNGILMLKSPQTELAPIDREALERAMQIARRDCAEQLDNKLKDEPWTEVAKFAAYHCQCNALALKLWELPPMHAIASDKASAGLLRQMLRAGLSR